ncbi:MAG: hypothetical protein VKN72_12550 [Nostocales cyanobacterium 94392]|nr:hypothetical protein [Nostocales cyanobacterium 94392]
MKSSSGIRSFSPLIREACQTNEFFNLLGKWGCGAIDGGCLMVALALKEVLNKGEIYALVGIVKHRKRKSYLHVLLRIGNLYIDGDGVTHKTLVLDRWNSSEYISEIEGLVPLTEPQIMIKKGTPLCKETICLLVNYFNKQLFN